mmetsp:Transcript_22785/g.73290  ORF Transcript_22785/g.73290 Transcript_22785/m.73290 type:complete len:164 (+) Transcript_22785:126-617(+)
MLEYDDVLENTTRALGRVLAFLDADREPLTSDFLKIGVTRERGGVRLANARDLADTFRGTEFENDARRAPVLAPGFAEIDALLLKPTSCFGVADRPNWHKLGDPAKTCAWVANWLPNRCTVKGHDRSWAYDACACACSLVLQTNRLRGRLGVAPTRSGAEGRT